MPRQAIRQATCTECGESGEPDDENFTVVDTDMQFEVDAIKYDVRCTCGEYGTVVVDADGTHSNDSVSHDEASWNEADEESN